MIQNQTFTAGATHEALELDGVRKVILRNDVFAGGSASLRIQDSRYVIVQDDTFPGALGHPDPDGQSLSLVRTGDAVITGCSLRANPRHTEDTLGIFSDKPIAGTVWVVGDVFTGHGPTDSGTAVCQDGEYPPPVVLEDDRIIDARCGVTACGQMVLKAVEFDGDGVPVYVAGLYGPRAVVLTDRPSDVLIGTGGAVGMTG